MMMQNLKWIYFVAKHMNRVYKKGRRGVASALSTLGIAFGVMALIVVMGVMNGFQMSFIDAILELTSYHVRVVSPENESEFISWCTQEPSVKSVTPFYDSQALMSSSRGQQSAAMIRSIDFEAAQNDDRFLSELHIIAGSFNLKDDSSIVLGNTLARNLGVNIGSSVVLVAMSGSSDVSLVSDSRIFTVTGIFYSGYSQINESYSCVNLSDGQKYFGKGAVKKIGIKLNDYSKSNFFINKIEKNFPGITAENWESFNRSFFGALKIEKNILMLLVLLIFLVVAVNIFNGMRKVVFERKTEAAVLLSFGAEKIHIQEIFMIQGFVTGLKGAFTGLIAGLLICPNMKSIFMFLSKAQYFAVYFFTVPFDRKSLAYLTENRMYAVYSTIPARVFFSETLLIFLFGLCSAIFASYFAGRSVLKIQPAEVLRDE